MRLSDLNPKNFVARHVLSADEKDDLLSIRDEFRSAGEVATEGLSGVRDGIEGARAESRATASADSVAGAADLASSDLLRAIAYDPEAT